MKKRFRTSRNLRPARIPRQVWSQRMFVKLPYWDNIQIVTTPGTDRNAFYLFSLNSLFDPDITSGGHQPRGFDQYSVLYGKYQVHGCRYNVRFYITGDTNAATARATTIQCGTICGPEFIQSQVNADIRDFNEYPPSKYVKKMYIDRGTAGSAIAANTMSSPVNTSLKGYVSMRRLYKDFKGIDYNTDQSYVYPADYQAAITTSPAAEQYLVLYSLALANAGLAIGVQVLPQIFVTIKLVYYVEFFKPDSPPVS